MADVNIKDGSANETETDLDATFAKHLDIAIEAQDGPSSANTETENKTEGGNEGGESKQPEVGNSNSGDNTAQPKSAEEVKKEAQSPNGAKDLTLDDGTVVRGGPERRFFEQRNIARERVTALEGQIANVERERDSFRDKFTQLENTVRDLQGADPQQVKIGLNIVRDLQRDPQGTMQKLLAEVIAQGYTVEGIGAGIDTAAITRLIEERLPKAADIPNEEQITADATREANEFFGRHPDAKPHDELLARMLSDNPTLSLQSAYYQLKDAFAERGFDWSRSLADNLNAGNTASSQLNNENGGNDNSNNQNNGPGLPNGGNAVNSDVVVNRGNISHESEDTGDIVRQAMREAGMKI